MTSKSKTKAGKVPPARFPDKRREKIPSRLSGAKAASTLFEDFLPYLLAQITQTLNQELQADLGQQGINIARWRVLAVLIMEDGRSIGGTADAAMMEQSALSRTIMSMEYEGLVERRAGPGDQRFMQVWLTADGRRLFDTLYPIVITRHARCVQGLSEREIATLFGLLHKVSANLATPYPSLTTPSGPLRRRRRSTSLAQ